MVPSAQFSRINYWKNIEFWWGMWYNIHLPKISRKYSSPKLFPTELIAEQEKLDLISDDREFRLRIGTFTPGIVTSFLKHCKYLFCIQYLDIVFSIWILYSVFGYCIQYPTQIQFTKLHRLIFKIWF